MSALAAAEHFLWPDILPDYRLDLTLAGCLIGAAGAALVLLAVLRRRSGLARDLHSAVGAATGFLASALCSVTVWLVVAPGSPADLGVILLASMFSLQLPLACLTGALVAVGMLRLPEHETRRELSAG